MKRRTQLWISALPLLAFLLAAGTSAPAVRHQGTSQQRHRIQRPTRTSGVRLDGDHHHEETPHYLLPKGNQEFPPGAMAAIPTAAALPHPVLVDAGTAAPPLVLPPSSRFPLFPPGRSPPASLLNTL